MHAGFRGRRRLGASASLGGTSFVVAMVLAGIGAAATTATDEHPGLTVDVRATPATRPEPGGDFEFRVTVHNGSEDTVTLTALTDDIAGDLRETGSCATGAEIPAGSDYACTYHAGLTGNAGDSRIDVVRATVRGEESEPISASAEVTVTLSDVPPTVEVTKKVDRATISPGDIVTFTVGVSNTSFEAVVLTSLVDSVHGGLDGQGTCTTGGTIAAGATYRCTFPIVITKTETDRVTGIVTDDEGGTASASAEATVAVFGLAFDKSNDAPIASLLLPDGSTAELPTAREGATIGYTLAYTLTGDPVHNVVITDVVPFGLQFVKGSAGSDPEFTLASFDASSGTLSWRAATLTTSGTITYRAFVLEGASSLSQPIENVAAIVSDDTVPTDDFSDIFVPAAVAGETSPPRVTPPPTDALRSEEPGSAGLGLALFLLTLTVVVTGICVATSTPNAHRHEESD